MARLLAIEWDDRELRIAIASPHGADISLEQAFAVSLDDANTGDDTEDVSVSSAGKALASTLAEHNMVGSDVLVAIGRANIELRVLSLPPAPPDEQPDLVRFQAMNSFTTIGEDWPLDYVPLAADEESATVLAATISPAVIQQIQEVCAAANCTPKRLVLRPFAAAGLLRRAGHLDESRCTLVVDRMENEADLSVIADGQVVLMRTVRLPEGGGETVRATSLIGELRRTIGAAQNQLGGRRIEQVIVLGDADQNAALENRVRSALSLDVESFDPLTAVHLARSLKAARPTESGRFTSLLGMLADEVAGTQHAVDFLNPRRRPEPPSQLRRNVLLGATAAVIVLGGLLTFWFRVHQMDRQIADLRSQVADMDKILERGQVTIDKVAAIHEFTDGDVTWLDELHEMARRLPNADDAILDEMTIGAHSQVGGIVTLKGHVKDAPMIAQFEDSLRYDHNVVSGRQGTVDRNKEDYPWLLDTTMVVPPDRRDAGESLGRPFRDDMRRAAGIETGPAKPPAATGGDTKPATPPAATGGDTKPATPPAATGGDTKPATPPADPPKSTENPASEKTGSATP